MRRALVVLTALVVLSGCAGKLAQPSSPGTPPSTGTTSHTPLLITVPNVVGKNAAVAVDELKKLGFTNIGLGTVDGRPAVVLPENWTVKVQSAQPGERLQANAKIVLGCVRNG
jgi:hypothetical protein